MYRPKRIDIRRGAATRKQKNYKKVWRHILRKEKLYRRDVILKFRLRSRYPFSFPGFVYDEILTTLGF